ncbi:hypothetical protein LK996_10425 [Lysobacter sp. A6]|uniref:Uncharacterized protein n=1 Tax=Noviluteimonas lactosilytica TaxID=2888523 RepID=A0ABS8JIQ1_9GAMM|nr:hypothetical protein [Lysobacter lactosilyticus]MCC8363488.1 hypothetical protein [Lysobacter lactosilyticus]
MAAYIPVAVVAFALAFYWQGACWALLKDVERRYPDLHAEMGRPKYGVPGTPFLSALTLLLFTDRAKSLGDDFYARIVRLRAVAVVMVGAFLMLTYLTTPAAT